MVYLYRKEFMSALYSSRPAAIVIGLQFEDLLGKPFTINDFPELAKFVADFYDTGRAVGNLTLYFDRDTTSLKRTLLTGESEANGSSLRQP